MLVKCKVIYPKRIQVVMTITFTSDNIDYIAKGYTYYAFQCL